ncbi:MAG: elongation factor P maturation arginine rhamnosyltransferase EarP, partial [Moraxellaceae bacterium]
MQCAIFCNVIDNFGDIGVCWRLARQLADEYSWQVSLFVDDLDSFAVLAPSLLTTLDVQPLDQIIVRRWHAQVLFEQAFDLVIEGFGCRLSDGLIAQLQAQAQAGQPALWLNLEYLSAEAWAIDCHGMTSIHPSTGLQQTFWFPSVTPQSGGLLREQNLIQQRDQFQQDYHQQAQQQAQFWHSLSVPDAMQFDRKISLFSYQNSQIADLLNVLAADHQSTLLLVPYSKSIPDIQNWLAQTMSGQDVAMHRVHTLHNLHTLQIGARITRNNLSIAVLPFLSHQQYDQLLWACDVNFVRGEDSCVRAQWAG